MSNAITLDSKSKMKGHPTFREILNREIGSYGFDFTKVKSSGRETPPPNVQANTKKDFKDSEIEFLSTVAKVYQSEYVTRQMVIAVNLERGQTSCPNYLNKNENCLTTQRGLYRLPSWAFPKQLRDEIRSSMKSEALAYREQKKLEAAQKKEEDAKKASEAKSEETSPEPKKKTSKAKAKKASAKKAKKASEPETIQPVAEEPVEAPTTEAAELTAPADDLNPTETSEEEIEVEETRD